MTKAKITVVKNGPLIVEGVPRYITAGGQEKDHGDRYELCRCGASFEKPFCDGSHVIFDFEDDKDDYRTPDVVDIYENDQMTLYFNRGVCSHRGICFEELPSVFRMEKSIPIDLEGASLEEIIDICHRCPSGALSFAIKPAGRDLHGGDDQPTIRVAPRRYGYDGPYEVSGNVDLIDPDGNLPESPHHYALCRCGHSKNMPFCSGDHWAHKFLDENSDEDVD